MFDALSKKLLRIAGNAHDTFGKPLNRPARTMMVKGEAVGYEVVRRDDDTQAPSLVVALHGFGADERQIQSLVPLNEVTSPIVYLAPRAPWTVVGGGFGWFPIDGDQSDDVHVEREDLDAAVDEVADFVSAALEAFEIPKKRAWIVGYSQGAPVALHLTAAYPDLIAGCAVGAGVLLSSGPLPHRLKSTSVMLAASTLDPFITLEDYEATDRAFREAGASTLIKTFDAPHVISASQATDIATWLSNQLS